MKVVKIFRKFLIFTGAVGVLVLWLGCTNSGLKTVLYFGKRISGYDVNYGQVDGKLIGQPITVHNLTYQEKDNTLQIKLLTVDWQLKTLHATQVRGFEFLLPYSDAIAANQGAKLDDINAKLEIIEEKQILDLKVKGTIQKHNINGEVIAEHVANDWRINHAVLKVADNLCTIKSISGDGYEWRIDLVKPHLILKDSRGKLHAKGTITNLSGIPVLNADLNAPDFVFQDYALKNLSLKTKMSHAMDSPLSVSAHADKIIVDDHIITATNINISGTGSLHDIKATAKYNDYKIKLAATGKVADLVWLTDNLSIQADDHKLRGAAKYNFKHFNADLILRGELFEFPTKITAAVDSKQHVMLATHIQANQHNYAKAQLAIVDQKLDGTVNVYADDLSLIMKWMPDLTRFKGLLEGNAKISGTLDEPIIESQAHLTQITATFPGFGVKVKPMELHLVGDHNGKFMIRGNGKMRRGPGDFTINGYIEPFKPDMPNELIVVGKNVEFINNTMAHLIASSDLKFVYNHTAYRVDVTGYLEIEEGNIYFPENNTSTVKSKDVVFINEPISEAKKDLMFNPSVNVRIDEGVNISGFNLNATISGKLDVTLRHDALYGEGRITIKEGTYKLPGQELHIEKGRLLYPPGTLLVNPMLDIKLRGKNAGEDTSQDLELVLQGTVQSPQISASGLNTDKVLSQALLTGSGILSKNILHDKLKISELGLTSTEEENFDFFGTDKHKNGNKDPKNLKNKDFVIGRPLGKKLHIQYLHNLGEQNQRVRLKYALNNIWSVGVESGNQGSGADLSFSFER